MEQSPLEANSHSDSQEIPRVLWDLSIHNLSVDLSIQSTTTHYIYLRSQLEATNTKK